MEPPLLCREPFRALQTWDKVAAADDDPVWPSLVPADIRARALLLLCGGRLHTAQSEL